MSLAEVLSPHLLAPHLLGQAGALGQVLLIDLMLAGDNAVVIGLAVAGLAPGDRRRAITLGIAGATVVRIAFAIVAVRLLAVVGLMLAGGVLLLWVCWRMFRDLRASHGPAAAGVVAAPRSLRAAMLQIVVADISMSLDNVLAVAGAAHGHPWILVVGLLISVAMMGLAANVLARLLERHRWIAWVGLAIVVYVAGRLVWQGYWDVARVVG